MNQQDIQNLKTKAEQGDAEAQFLLGKHYDGKDDTQAVNWYRRAAEQGHAKAQNNLGLYLKETDLNEAAEWFRKGAENGSVAAQFNLGRYYLDCHGGDATGLREAIKWFRRAAEHDYELAKIELSALSKVEGLLAKAEQGDAEAMNKIAMIFDNYIPRNPNRAFKWFLAAAENGCGDARFEVGSRYLSGDGVQDDGTEALKWLVKAAEQGHPEAQQTVIRKVEFDLVSRAAENGDAGSQFRLGTFYRDGHGVKKDDEAAFRWFVKAAEQGHAEAQFVLGKQETVRSHGLTPAAAAWYRKAAEQGHAEAQFVIGRCYKNGFGVERDENQAFQWFSKAAKQDIAAAQYALSLCYRTGSGVKKDEAEALEWLQKAAQHHCPGAGFELGMRYYYGNGAEQNYAFAFECFLHAASESHGDDDGSEDERNDVWQDDSTHTYDRNLTPMDMLSKCYAEGHGVQKCGKRARFWYYWACRSRGMFVDFAEDFLEYDYSDEEDD